MSLAELARLFSPENVPPGAFVFLYAAITSIPFPGTRLVAVGAGAIYGAYLGFGVVYGGALLGATLGFLGSRHVLSSRLGPRLRARFPKVFAETDRNAGVYLWTLRMSPLFSFALVHYVMGLTRIGFARFLGVTAVVSFLYSALYVSLGTALRGVADEQGRPPWTWLLVAAVLALVPLAFRKRIAAGSSMEDARS